MILFRYQLRAVLVRLALTLPALVSVYLIFDLGDQGRRLAVTAGWTRVLAATFLHVPLVSVQVLPAALLLAALLAIFRLREVGELEAMAAAGGSPLRWLKPLLAAGLLAVAAAVLLGELLGPTCERRADAWLGAERSSPITGEGPPSGWFRRGSWFLQLTPLPQGRTALVGLEHDGDFRVRRQVAGQVDSKGQLETGPALAGLAFRNVSELGLDGEGLSELRRRPEALSVTGLRRRVERLRAAGRSRPAEELLLQTRLVLPCLNLLVALLGWTFAGHTRGRPLLRELALGLGWLLLLFVLLALGWLLARAGWLSPVAGAWLPPGLGLVLVVFAAVHAFRH